MFALTEQHKYYLYAKDADMRKGFNGLSGLVLNEMGSNPKDGNVYIFINKRKNLMKLLVYMEGGFVLYYKRLEQGTFEIPKSNSGNSRVLNWHTLVLMIRGLSLMPKQVRKRYKRA